MKKKDIEIKKGDVVYFKDEINKVIVCYDGVKINENSNIVKIERPVKYKTIYEEPKEILTKEEKEWLENFLRPFKDRVKSICKFNIWVAGRYNEFIRIIYQSIRDGEERLDLPEYKSGTMYKDMEQDKKYTLDELGLFKE